MADPLDELLGPEKPPAKPAQPAAPAQPTSGWTDVMNALSRQGQDWRNSQYVDPRALPFITEQWREEAASKRQTQADKERFRREEYGKRADYDRSLALEEQKARHQKELKTYEQGQQAKGVEQLLNQNRGQLKDILPGMFEDRQTGTASDLEGSAPIMDSVARPVPPGSAKESDELLKTVLGKVADQAIQGDRYKKELNHAGYRNEEEFAKHRTDLIETFDRMGDSARADLARSAPPSELRILARTAAQYQDQVRLNAQKFALAIARENALIPQRYAAFGAAMKDIEREKSNLRAGQPVNAEELSSRVGNQANAIRNQAEKTLDLAIQIEKDPMLPLRPKKEQEEMLKNASDLRKKAADLDGKANTLSEEALNVARQAVGKPGVNANTRLGVDPTKGTFKVEGAREVRIRHKETKRTGTIQLMPGQKLPDSLEEIQ